MVNVFKKTHDKNTHRLYVSKLFGKGYYVIAISDMYHVLIKLRISFLPIGAVAYKQLPPDWHNSTAFIVIVT